MNKSFDKFRSTKITITYYEASLFMVSLLTLFPTLVALVLQVRQDSITGEMNNLRIYLLTALIFLVLIIFSLLLCKRFVGSSGDGAFKEWGIGAICVALILQAGIFSVHIWSLMKCYLNSVEVFPYLSGEWLPWHKKENWKLFLFMAIVGSAGIIVSFWSKKKRKIIEIVRFPIYLAASLVGGASMYCTNFLQEDILHGNAYFSSVYTALMGAPFDYANQSIYGHYAIFLKYPIKLLGGDYRAYNIVISLVGALSIFMVALALDMCVGNHFISMIGTWTLPMMYLYYPKNHWQMFPHRVLFACITLYAIARYFHKKERWLKFIGYGLGAIAVLWNAETGIICLIVWAVACILFDFINAEKGCWKCIRRSILYHTGYVIISVLVMVVLFNLYNMPLGEQWHGLRFLLFPLYSGWDMEGTMLVQAAEKSGLLYKVNFVGLLEKLSIGFASGITQPLIYKLSPWYFVFLLMGIAIVLMMVRILHKKVKANDCVIGVTAILALGQLYYFFNRPCFDYLAIAEFEAVLIMAVIADGGTKKECGWMKRPYQFLFVAIMTVLSVFTLWQARYRFAAREAEGYYDNSEMEALLDDMRETIPEDTFAFGQGVHEIYSSLGWDTRCHIIDYSSLSNDPHAVTRLIVDISLQEECVVSVRNKRKNEEVNIEEYMELWGFDNSALTVKAHWKIDTDEAWYWDIYYIDIDRSIENRHYNAYKDKI